MIRDARQPAAFVLSLGALLLLLILALPGMTAAAPAPKFTVESVTGTLVDGDLGQLIASCDQGYHVTGGGYELASINPALFVHQDGPLEPSNNDGLWAWAVTTLNESGVDVTWSVAALCTKD